MRHTVWYVVTRPDNGYPVLIYPDKSRAEMVASKNDYRVVPVRPIEAKAAKPED